MILPIRSIITEEIFTPSTIICVDISISLHYGIGGEYFNYGFPMYVEINRNTESDCDIKYDTDGKFGIIMLMRLVNTTEEEKYNSVR